MLAIDREAPTGDKEIEVKAEVGRREVGVDVDLSLRDLGVVNPVPDSVVDMSGEVVNRCDAKVLVDNG